tara:strand:+ start:4043 stop:5752 length:1710 start_codon:yes stop_codon:yes gene_type:complete
MKSKNKSLLFLIFFIIFPLVIITFFADYNFIDTSNYFFRTLLSGNYFYMYSSDWPFYNPLESEYVFQPFVGIAQNIALIFNLIKYEESIFFAQFLIFFISLIFLKKIVLKKNNFYEFSVILTFILSPPFIFSFFQPLLTETIFILFLTIFLFTIKKFIDENKLYYLFFMIVLISLILLSKRSSIIILFSLNFFLMALSIKTYNKTYIFSFLICFIYSIVGYFFLVSYTKYSGIGDPLKNPIDFFYYYARTDFIILYIYFISFLNILYNYNSKLIINNFYTISLLLTSTVYFFALVIFGKHSEYQQVICYLLVLPYFINCDFNNEFFKKRLVLITTFIFFLPLIFNKDIYAILIIFIFINIFIFVFKRKVKYLFKNYVLNILITFSIFYLILPGTSMIYHRYLIGKNIDNVFLNLKPYEELINNPEIFIHSSTNPDCNESVMHNVIFNERLNYYFKKDYKLFKNPINNIEGCKKSLEYFESYYFPVSKSIFENYQRKGGKIEPDIIISNYFSNKNALNSFLLNHSINPSKYKLFEYEFNYIWNIYYRIVSRISAFEYRTPIVYLLVSKSD